MRFYLFPRRSVLGMRAGVSFTPQDLGMARPAPPRPVASTYSGSFVYVIQGDHGRCKVGVTKNPASRLASLQTGASGPLRVVFLGVTPGTGFDIEREAHSMLKRYHFNGEWFDASPELAISALMGAAAKLREPVQPMSLEQANRAVGIATSQVPDGKPWNVPILLLQVLVFFVTVSVGISAGATPVPFIIGTSVGLAIMIWLTQS